jgi:hypothetical protein
MHGTPGNSCAPMECPIGLHGRSTELQTQGQSQAEGPAGGRTTRRMSWEGLPLPSGRADSGLPAPAPPGEPGHQHGGHPHLGREVAPGAASSAEALPGEDSWQSPEPGAWSHPIQDTQGRSAPLIRQGRVRGRRRRADPRKPRARSALNPGGRSGDAPRVEEGRIRGCLVSSIHPTELWAILMEGPLNSHAGRGGLTSSTWRGRVRVANAIRPPNIPDE